MKHRIVAMIAGIVAVTVITGATIAEEDGQSMQHGKMMQDKQEMSGKKGMMKNKPMMQDCMMKRQVVATEDGGVIIVVGNLLIKYDKDLKLIKKTTIDISDEDMQQMMEKMKKQCGMCRKMSQGKMADEEAAEMDE